MPCLFLNKFKSHMSVNSTATVVQVGLEKLELGGLKEMFRDALLRHREQQDCSRSLRQSDGWSGYTQDSKYNCYLQLERYEETCCILQRQTETICKNVHTFLDICVLSEKIKTLLNDCINYGT